MEVRIRHKKTILFIYALVSLLFSTPLLIFLSRWSAVSLVYEASTEQIDDYSISRVWECYYVERGQAHEWKYGLVSENRFKFIYCLMSFFLLVSPFLYQFVPFGFALIKNKK